MKKIVKMLVRGLLIVTVIAAISLLVFFGIKMNRMQLKLNEIASQLFYLQDSASVIQSDLNSMEENIEATLEEESSLIEDCTIRVTDCDFTKGTYDVDITVLPKEYTETTQTCIYFGTKGYHLELQGFLFKGTATLSMKNNYDGNVTVLFTNGEKRSTEVLHNYTGFQTTMQKALEGEILDATDSYEDGILDFACSVNYDLDGQSDFEFESFHLVAEVGQRTVYDYDLIREHGGLVERVTEENGEAAAATVGEEESDEETEAAGVEEQEAIDAMTTEVTDAAETAEPEAEASEEPEGAVTEEKPEKTVYISGTSGTHDMSFNCEMAETDTIKIYFYAVTKEGYKLQLMLLDGSFSTEEEDRIEGLSSYEPELYLYDRRDVLWK